MVTKSNFVNNGQMGRKIGFILLLSLMILSLAMSSRAAVTVNNIERVSLGTGSIEGNLDSYYISISEDAAVVSFESFVSNWGPDQVDINFVDIFVRDRNGDATRKISVGPNGEQADQRSFDPAVSADGRYVSFISYATNLVPGDTNREDYVDNGLDVFVYDRVTNTLKRESLNHKGEQINDNSVGFISPDGQYVIFATNGQGIVAGETNSGKRSAIYIRNLQSGAIERISRGPNGEFPDDVVVAPMGSSDNRFVVYLSDATNLVANDTNGLRDVMLFDRQTQETMIVSKPIGGGQANGTSSPAVISADGRFVAFRSFASNLVPEDTNGQSDIFVYDRVLNTMELVSLSSTGALGNAESKDPAICGNGRFVSFTSEATNLVPQAHNGQRQVYLHDRVTGTTALVTGTATAMGNGRAHRSTLSADCSTIGFSTEASNMIANDLNGVRDLFVADVIVPADLASSTVIASGGFEPGEIVTYTFQLTNIGTETAVVTFNSPIPGETTYVSGSVSGAGAVFDGSANAVQWTGNVPGEGEVSISYGVTVNPGLVDFTFIENQTEISYNGTSETLRLLFAVNGLKTFLPLVSR